MNKSLRLIRHIFVPRRAAFNTTFSCHQLSIQHVAVMLGQQNISNTVVALTAVADRERFAFGRQISRESAFATILRLKEDPMTLAEEGSKMIR